MVQIWISIFVCWLAHHWYNDIDVIDDLISNWLGPSVVNSISCICDKYEHQPGVVTYLEVGREASWKTSCWRKRRVMGRLRAGSQGRRTRMKKVKLVFRLVTIRYIVLTNLTEYNNIEWRELTTLAKLPSYEALFIYWNNIFDFKQPGGKSFLNI